MKTLISTFCLAILTACGGGGDQPINNATAQVTPAPASSTIHAAGQVINTGPQPCDTKAVTAEWKVGPSGAQLVMSRQWVGFDYSLESDTDVTTSIIDASGNVIATVNRQQLDNYKHRSFEQERWVSFAPFTMTIPPNGGLRVSGFCNPIAGGSNFHITVSVWLL